MPIPAQDLEGMTQRGAIAEILKSFAGASVYLDPPTIGVPAKVTPGSIFEARYPMAMPETEVYPVRMDALICTPASPRKSEQRWAYEFRLLHRPVRHLRLQERGRRAGQLRPAKSERAAAFATAPRHSDAAEAYFFLAPVVTAPAAGFTASFFGFLASLVLRCCPLAMALSPSFPPDRFRLRA